MIIQYYDDLYIDPKDVIGENGIMKANFLTQDYIKITIKRKDTRVFNLIIDNIKNKNPIVSAHMTALHLAARTGCLSICKVIIENIDDLNPLNNTLHWNVQFDIVTMTLLISLKTKFRKEKKILKKS